MKCPYCNSNESSVVDSRDTEENTVRRRRECEKCKKRFTSYERIELIDLVVVKKDGTREPFDREKVKKGILKACEKRPVSAEDIEKAVDEIDAIIRKKETTEIPSKEIGELVMKKLQKLDKVAYIRFASVYKSFADVEEFQDEIKRLLNK